MNDYVKHKKSLDSKTKKKLESITTSSSSSTTSSAPVVTQPAGSLDLEYIRNFESRITDNVNNLLSNFMSKITDNITDRIVQNRPITSSSSIASNTHSFSAPLSVPNTPLIEWAAGGNGGRNTLNEWSLAGPSGVVQSGPRPPHPIDLLHAHYDNFISHDHSMNQNRKFVG